MPEKQMQINQVILEMSHFTIEALQIYEVLKVHK